MTLPMGPQRPQNTVRVPAHSPADNWHTRALYPLVRRRGPASPRGGVGNEAPRPPSRPEPRPPAPPGARPLGGTRTRCSSWFLSSSWASIWRSLSSMLPCLSSACGQRRGGQPGWRPHKSPCAHASCATSGPHLLTRPASLTGASGKRQASPRWRPGPGNMLVPTPGSRIRDAASPPPRTPGSAGPDSRK